MNYKSFMRTHNLSNGDMIEAVKSIYPKYSKVQQTMCCSPEKYGVRLTPEAERLIKSRFGKPKPKRKETNRVSARLDDELYAKMNDFMAKNNLTQQDLISELITNLED